MNMKKLFTLVALAVAAFSVIGTQAFAQSGTTKKVRPAVHAQTNKKGYGAYALIPNNYYTVPSSLGPAERFGEASQR
jgi:hypothetical protein